MHGNRIEINIDTKQKKHVTSGASGIQTNKQTNKRNIYVRFAFYLHFKSTWNFFARKCDLKYFRIVNLHLGEKNKKEKRSESESERDERALFVYKG